MLLNPVHKIYQNDSMHILLIEQRRPILQNAWGADVVCDVGRLNSVKFDASPKGRIQSSLLELVRSNTCIELGDVNVDMEPLKATCKFYELSFDMEEKTTVDVSAVKAVRLSSLQYFANIPAEQWVRGVHR